MIIHFTCGIKSELRNLVGLGKIRIPGIGFPIVLVLSRK